MLDRGGDLEDEALLEQEPGSALPRAQGAVRLTAVRPRRDAASAIGALRQEGALKLMFPRPTGLALEAVLLNSAGGLTGGDRMRLEAGVAAGAELVLSTQAAERAYRALGVEPARVEVRLAVAAAARLDWLPQETLLYDGARLERRLSLDLAPDASALLVEAVVLGRQAMGETVRRGSYREAWDLRRDGRLVFADRLRLDGDMTQTLGRSLAGCRAFATIVCAGPEAGARLARIRRLLPPAGGASRLDDGLLLVRLLAADGFTLRRDLLPILETLARRPLPKVWRL